MSKGLMLKAIFATAVLGLALVGPQVQGQEQIDVNASGACRGALPVFESNIRSRPTGVRNEGNQNVFVTCSLPATLYEPLTSVAVFVANSGASNVDVTCTMVNGRNPMFFETVYQTLTQTVGAADYEWFSYELGVDYPDGGDLPNFSCNLPPGTEINMVSKSNFPRSP